jgi:hypothetical protein
MKEVILYPPNGGLEGVIPHPTKIEAMKKKGWTEEQSVNKEIKSKEKDHGSN